MVPGTQVTPLIGEVWAEEFEESRANPSLSLNLGSVGENVVLFYFLFLFLFFPGEGLEKQGNLPTEGSGSTVSDLRGFSTKSLYEGGDEPGRSGSKEGHRKKWPAGASSPARVREKVPGVTCLWESVMAPGATCTIPTPKQNLHPGNLFHPYSLACGANREQTPSHKHDPRLHHCTQRTLVDRPVLHPRPQGGAREVSALKLSPKG